MNLAASESFRRQVDSVGTAGGKSARVRLFLETLVVWVLVGLFWYFTTLQLPSACALARTVTISLVVAYATAVYLNHLLFIPRFWRANRWPAYWGSLLMTMIALTTIAVAIIRVSYIRSLGPDPNPNGFIRSFCDRLCRNGWACVGGRRRRVVVASIYSTGTDDVGVKFVARSGLGYAGGGTQKSLTVKDS